MHVLLNIDYIAKLYMYNNFPNNLMPPPPQKGFNSSFISDNFLNIIYWLLKKYIFIPGFLNLRKTTTTAMTIARVIPPAAAPPVITGKLLEGSRMIESEHDCAKNQIRNKKHKTDIKMQR